MSTGIYIDSATGDYVLREGSIENRNAILTEAYMRLSCPLGKYINDPTFGSELFSFFNTRANITKNMFEQAIRNALSPMVVAGKIAVQRIDIVAAVFGRYVAKVFIITRDGEVLHFPWEAII